MSTVSKYQTVEVPIQSLKDGRKFISDQNIAENPWILDFINRFPNYWTRDYHLNGFVSPKVYLTEPQERDKMPYRPGDPTREIEGKIEFESEKAFLVIPTMGPNQIWIPKSQIVDQSEPDGDGNIMFEVTEWWYGKSEFGSL